MKIDQDFYDSVAEVADEEISRLKIPYKLDLCLNRYIQIIAMSTAINYHKSLRKELLKYGIDIGDFDADL